MNKTFTISFNKDLADVVAKEMKRGKFANTSEFFRHLVRTQFLFKTYPIETLSRTDSVSKASKLSARNETFVPLSQAKKQLDL